MSKEDSKLKHALLDWENEKKYQETILSDPTVNFETKERTRARIEEAEKMIKEIEAFEKESEDE